MNFEVLILYLKGVRTLLISTLCTFKLMLN